MNVNALQEYLKNKDFLRVAGILLGSIAVLAAVYCFLIVPQNKKIHALRNEAAVLEAKVQQYKSFESFKETLGTQRERIARTLSSIGGDESPTDRTDQGVFEAIGRVCSKAEIKLDKITPIKDNNQQQAWTINFKASYDRITAFAAQIERSFRIDTINIVGGRNNNNHTVTMVVYPIDIPALAAVPADQGKDLFALYNEADAALKGLESGTAASSSVPSITRDPMTFSETLYYTERKEPVKTEPFAKEKAPSVQRPDIPVEAVFWDPDMPLVSIGGKVLKEGDTQNDYTIVKIREKSVDVKWRSRVFTYEPK